jgi:uncharacterized protein DUF5947
VTAAGLRRYARAEPAAAPAPPPAVVERCGLCGADLGGRHGHVVALDDRALRCTCRPCYLLFTPAGAAGGRIRAVPERYLTDPERPIADSDWDRLQIPVTTAFFDLAGWERLRQSYPLLCRPEPDVEAIYATSAGPAIEAYLVPIDACFALAGAVRLRWQGIDGGPDVRQALAEFRDDLRRRSRPYGAG